jgi:hypothetical protein
VARQLLGGGLPLLAATWGEARVLSVRDDLVSIQVPQRRLALLADEEQATLLGTAVGSVLGRRVRIRATAGSETGTTGDERTRRYQAAERHPLVQDLMKRFQAELVGRELVDFETWLRQALSPPRRDGPPADAVWDEGP